MPSSQVHDLVGTRDVMSDIILHDQTRIILSPSYEVETIPFVRQCPELFRTYLPNRTGYSVMKLDKHIKSSKLNDVQIRHSGYFSAVK